MATCSGTQRVAAPVSMSASTSSGSSFGLARIGQSNFCLDLSHGSILPQMCGGISARIQCARIQLGHCARAAAIRRLWLRARAPPGTAASRGRTRLPCWTRCGSAPCSSMAFAWGASSKSSRQGAVAMCRLQALLPSQARYALPDNGPEFLTATVPSVLDLAPGWQIVRLAGMIAALRISVVGMDASPPHRRRRGVQG